MRAFSPATETTAFSALALETASSNVNRVEKPSGTRHDGRRELQSRLDFLPQTMSSSSRALTGSPVARQRRISRASVYRVLGEKEAA